MATEVNKITVSANIATTIDQVWKKWTSPLDIIHWNFAHESWHAPNAINDLRVGGTFSYRMEARDGSFGFDFAGTYTTVEDFKKICYTLGDDRSVEVLFEEKENGVLVTETFDPENENPIELQQQGWQMILNNFKNYVEAL
jgi:uncharacterized protein YndB with AHSA1/START domain